MPFERCQFNDVLKYSPSWNWPIVFAFFHQYVKLYFIMDNTYHSWISWHCSGNLWHQLVMSVSNIEVSCTNKTYPSLHCYSINSPISPIPAYPSLPCTNHPHFSMLTSQTSNDSCSLVDSFDLCWCHNCKPYDHRSLLEFFMPIFSSNCNKWTWQSTVNQITTFLFYAWLASLYK